MIDRLADDVGMFKVGLELFIRSGPDVIQWIRQAGSANVFLDLKLHDIPVTVKRAMSRVADLGVFFATVHCGESLSMLEAAVEGAADRVNVLGVTVLTSVTSQDIAAAGFQDRYATDLSQLVMERAAMAKAAGCAGIVCSGQEVKEIRTILGKDFQLVTPGIRPGGSRVPADDQSRVVTPVEAIRRGADYIVIGRPIRDAADPKVAAQTIAKQIRRELSSAGEPNAHVEK